jgi:vacuolar-type H+-ATPase subunit H
MADTGAPEATLPPLDLVRKEERDVTRRILAAQELADKAIVEAQARAEEIRQQARESSIREAEKRYKEILAEAEAEAETLLSQAQVQAKELRRHGKRHMEEAIRRVLQIVLGDEWSGSDA